MKMNLPNQLTILRVCMIPFFLIFMLGKFDGTWAKWVALIIFVVASLTDLLDGKIARKYNLVTNFGKFMDPLADKLLVGAALISFVELGQVPAWIVIVIISREFIISGFRLIAADKGIVMAAGMSGKLKTVCQMVMIVVVIANIPCFEIVETILIYASLILTIVSMCDYLYHNRNVLAD